VPEPAPPSAPEPQEDAPEPEGESVGTRRVGIVDLGSNSARLVVYAYEPGRWFQLVDQIKEPIRLGSGLHEGRLDPDGLERAREALVLYADYARATGLGPLEVLATSAVRDADDDKILKKEAKRLGLDLSVLSGEEEARLGALAVANSFEIGDGWAIDLGGGSVQVSRLVDRRPASADSHPLGAVRLTEAFLASDPPKPKEVAALEARVEKKLRRTARAMAKDGAPIVGIGGTIRNLAKAVQRKREYPMALHGYLLERSDLEDLTQELMGTTAARRASITGINPDRADVVVAGALVIRWLLREAGSTGIWFGGQGIRVGAFYRHFLRAPHLLPDVRRFTVDNLGHRHEPAPEHGARVGHLARRLYHELRPLHGGGDGAARLLETAVRLHEVGKVVSTQDHDLHGAYLIETSPMAGFTHGEQALLTLLVRYHRQGIPKPGELTRVLSEREGDLLLPLALCLRLAGKLERSRSGRVRDVEVKIGKRTVRVTVVADEPAYTELWEARKEADLFEKAFGRRLLLRTR
jgi:exopolyphosphatase/guanosine-5'-triphosphate,3'-diphosphate pyrophosphatase